MNEELKKKIMLGSVLVVSLAWLPFIYNAFKSVFEFEIFGTGIYVIHITAVIAAYTAWTIWNKKIFIVGR